MKKPKKDRMGGGDPLMMAAASSSSSSAVSGFPFAGLPVSPLTKDSTAALTGKRKCFQDALYALEAKSGEDENDFDSMDGLGGQPMMTEEDFGGAPASASSSTSTTKASPTTATDLMECPKRECSKMFKDLHAIKFHLSHAHNELEEAHNKRMRERELQKKKEREEEREEEEERRKAATVIKKEAASTVGKTETKQEVKQEVGAAIAAVSMVKKEENGHMEEARRHLEQAVNLVRSNGNLPTAAAAAAATGAPVAHVASHLPQYHPHHHPHHPQQRTAIVRPILNSPPPAKLPPVGPPPTASAMAAAASQRHPGQPNTIQGLPPPAHMSFNGMANKAAAAKPLPAPAQPPHPAKPAVKAAPSPTYSDISDEETEAPVPAGASAPPTRPSLPPAQQGLVIPRVPPQATSKPIMGNIRDGTAVTAALGTRPSTQSIGPPSQHPPPGFPHGHLGLGGIGHGGPPPPPHLLGNPFSYLNSGVPPPPAHGAPSPGMPPAAHVASMVNAMMSAGVPPSQSLSAARPLSGASSAAPRHHVPPSPASQMQEMMNAANKYLASTKLQELQEKAHGGGGGNKAPSAAAFPYGASPAAAMAAAAAMGLAPPPPSPSSMSAPPRQSSSPLASPKPGAPKPAVPPPAHFGHPPHPQLPQTSAAAANPFGLVHPSLGSVAASLPFQSEYNTNGAASDGVRACALDCHRLTLFSATVPDLLGNPPRMPPMFPPK